MANMRLMMFAHMDLSQRDPKRQLELRSIAFFVPLRLTFTPTAGLNFTTTRSLLSLLPPCTKKHQRVQQQCISAASELLDEFVKSSNEVRAAPEAVHWMQVCLIEAF